mmetsp:Transcript_19976/g.26188  ORF Transcript_19976/g.26188 Transcript_19976/m.26188 type:complete len:200 (-) Transcript_19976:327-926(-)
MQMKWTKFQSCHFSLLCLPWQWQHWPILFCLHPLILTKALCGTRVAFISSPLFASYSCGLPFSKLGKQIQEVLKRATPKQENYVGSMKKLLRLIRTKISLLEMISLNFAILVTLQDLSDQNTVAWLVVVCSCLIITVHLLETPSDCTITSGSFSCFSLCLWRILGGTSHSSFICAESFELVSCSSVYTLVFSSLWLLVC